MIDPRRDSGINTLLCNYITFLWNVSLLTTCHWCNLRIGLIVTPGSIIHIQLVVIQVKHASSFITKVDCML